MQRFVISSSHSPLGISSAAMEDTRLAIADLTTAEGLAKLDKMASFMLFLKNGSS